MAFGILQEVLPFLDVLFVWHSVGVVYYVRHRSGCGGQCKPRLFSQTSGMLARRKKLRLEAGMKCMRCVLHHL